MIKRISSPIAQLITNPFYTDCFFESDMLDIGDTEANADRINLPREKALLTIKLRSLREKRGTQQYLLVYN